MAHDLYSFLRTFTDLRDLVFSYLCKHEDNRFVLRQLSRSFYNLSLFQTLSVDKQSRAFLTRFFRTNRVRKLILRNHNRNLFRIPRETLRHVRKIIMYSLNEKEIHLSCTLFSRVPVINLKMVHCTGPLPRSLSLFSSLQHLDIVITSRDNQDIVFDLLRLNRATLKKLKIGIYTSRGVDEAAMQEILVRDLRLEHIDVRADLFTYDMIRPCTRRIAPIIPYIESKNTMLRSIVRLRLDGLVNRHLPILFKNLSVVEQLSLFGGLSNFEHVPYKDGHEFGYILRDYDDRDLSIPYDGTMANVDAVQSEALAFLYMKGFTIGDFPDTPLKEMMITDVCFVRPVYLSVLKDLYVENEVLNPRCFSITAFRLPRLTSLGLIHCLVKDVFVYNRLGSLNIQHSIISIDVRLLMRRHKRYLKTLLFYSNQWPEWFDKEGSLRLARTLHINAREPEDW